MAPLDLLRLQGAINWMTQTWATTIIALWIPLIFALRQAVASGGLRRFAMEMRQSLGVWIRFHPPAI